jgi:microsomal epoxide hydrolase
MITPFRIQVPEVVLDDLKQRLRRTRWPDQVSGSGWDYGTDSAYLRELVAYWADGFDWRRQEEMLNRLPQFMASVEGQDIHFVHARSGNPGALPLLISHGWPGSFFEMYKVIPLLTDPGAHGGDPADAFDVIVPSLPGFGFSGRPTGPGMSAARMAEVFHGLMTQELGYQRYGAQGGDWGSVISGWLGRLNPQAVAGIHITLLIGRTGTAETEEEKALEAQAQQWQLRESAYARLHQTKPQTASYALNDSPAGLAAWITEKFRTWSDCGGDIESRFSKDELLTNLTIYWVTQTIGSSMRIYYETVRNSRPQPRVEVPTGIADFPGEIVRTTARLANLSYNVTHWTTMPRGGHFAALEEPDLLVEDIRDFFRPLRRIASA